MDGRSECQHHPSIFPSSDLTHSVRMNCTFLSTSCRPCASFNISGFSFCSNFEFHSLLKLLCTWNFTFPSGQWMKHGRRTSEIQHQRTNSSGRRQTHPLVSFIHHQKYILHLASSCCLPLSCPFSIPSCYSSPFAVKFHSSSFHPTFI